MCHAPGFEPGASRHAAHGALLLQLDGDLEGNVQAVGCEPQRGSCLCVGSECEPYDLEALNSLSDIVNCRLSLLLYIATALRGTWIVEQPVGSDYVFPRHHRFEEFCNTVAFAARSIR